uniref:Uncharacterized protein n=1 Tax=Alexandrium andersonii TaxID=327968 RepID=A0A7S2C403_9DINO|mmetsp:Transcript_33902/g.77097  ORF Transcript_33902/g.77097 Transcript_33902/m.77097 type:complete len:174 (+) Transcript_33902:116-637(+)
MRGTQNRPGSAPGHAILSPTRSTLSPSPRPASPGVSRMGGTSSPRQEAASGTPFGSPTGATSSRGCDLWRVKRRVLGLPHLNPIEETLRQRRQLQSAASAPDLRQALIRLPMKSLVGGPEVTLNPGFVVEGGSTAPRLRKLPVELVDRIKDCGWSQTDGQGCPWIRRSEQRSR